MIPGFGLGEVLPPFMGDDVVGAVLERSPYKASMLDLVNRFGTSPERGMILSGLLAFRQALRDAGFADGFQWVDGSFVENCETVKGRPPGDVDVVSILYRPAGFTDDPEWEQFIEDRSADIFDGTHIKATFFCDSYFIDLGIEPDLIAEQCAYWFGLFSHQRDTFRWKGLVQIDLDDDDEAAVQLALRQQQW